MKKRGFTLVELLTVIVILSILLLIAVPKISNVIENAQIGAYKSTNSMIVSELRRQNGLEINPQVYTFTDGVMSPDIGITGELPDSGTVEINNLGQIQVVTSNDKYCAIKRFDEDNVAIFDAGDRNCNVIVEITLIVNPNGGTYEGSTSNTTYSIPTEDFQTINDPTRAGYTFDGWALEGEGSYSSWLFQSGYTDATLTAKWILNPTLTVNLNSGSTPQTFNASYSPNTELTLINPTRTNYTFTGWTVSGTGSTVSGTTFTMGTADTTLTANWSINPILTVNSNSGTWSGTTPQYVASGASVTINNPTRTNYTFTGWTVSGTGSSISGTTFTMGTANTTLTANWTLNTYTLTVNANGGTWSGTTPQTIAIGGTTTVSNPTRSGYVFSGWTVSGAGSSMSGTTFTMGTANATLTANWLAYTSMYTYTGSSTVVDNGSGNWTIKLLTSGTFTPLVNMSIDAFLVGGGGGGGNVNSWSAGGGGGGGYTTTQGLINLTTGSNYSIVIGAAGGNTLNGSASTAFGYSAAGGAAGQNGTGGLGGAGGAGGSGGGGGGSNQALTNGGSGGAGGSFGNRGSNNNRSGTQSQGGSGQGYAACEFNEGTLAGCNNGVTYSGGGGGGAGQSSTGYGAAGANGSCTSGYGCGGRGKGTNTAYTAATNGIVIIRNHR